MDGALIETLPGVAKIVHYDNIAIVVLSVCLISSGLGNVWLLRYILGLKDVLSNLVTELTKLNERIK